MEEKQALEAFKELIEKNVSLYANGTLEQYGLTDEQSLEIVSGLTGLTKERLKEVKEERNKTLKDNINSFNTNNDPTPVISIK